MHEPLKRAISALQITDVYLKSSSVHTMEQWDPKREDFSRLKYQFLHVIDKSEIIDVEENEGPDSDKVTSKSFFLVYITLGSRVVDQNALEDEGDKKHAKEPFAQIEGTFVAEYSISDDFDKSDEEALKAFALSNASFHVWPYWREYLMSTCTRLNLPKIPLPVKQFTKS
ncbi:hypothetical protein ACQ661_08130 [Pseudidiomarina sp. WS423]|uniref:hypothetical protein n=1 Tax=Pseudidiomarina sp. WS423 TaxID=3425124 RepID=UPI003D6FAC62